MQFTFVGDEAGEPISKNTVLPLVNVLFAPYTFELFVVEATIVVVVALPDPIFILRVPTFVLHRTLEKVVDLFGSNTLNVLVPAPHELEATYMGRL